MKDAKGHGSEKRSQPGGEHQSGVRNVGRVPTVSKLALDTIVKNANTGFSVKPNGSISTTGFQVAVQGRTDKNPLDLNNIAGHVQAHVDANADIYRDPAMHIGGRSSPYTGKVHLEPSQNVPDRETAERLGRERERDQVEIWDNKNLTNIKTGGTGK